MVGFPTEILISVGRPTVWRISLKNSLIAILTLILWSAVSAFAQTGEMHGLVRDASGAVIPHAKVELTNAGTRSVRIAYCDDQGFYALAFLPTGDYSARVTAESFQTLV